MIKKKRKTLKMLNLKMMRTAMRKMRKRSKIKVKDPPYKKTTCFKVPINKNIFLLKMHKIRALPDLKCLFLHLLSRWQP